MTVYAELDANFLIVREAVYYDGITQDIFKLPDGHFQIQQADGTATIDGHPVSPIQPVFATVYDLRFFAQDSQGFATKLVAWQNGLSNGDLSVRHFDGASGATLQDAGDPFSQVSGAPILTFVQHADGRAPDFTYDLAGNHYGAPPPWLVAHIEAPLKLDVVATEYTADGHLSSFSHQTTHINAFGVPSGVTRETYTFLNPRTPELQQQFGGDAGRLIEKEIVFPDRSRSVDHYYADGSLQLHEVFRNQNGQEYLAEYRSITPAGRVLQASYNPSDHLSTVLAINNGIAYAPQTLPFDLNDLIGRPLQVISNDGGSLVAQGGGNLVAQGGGNLISQDGGGVITHDGGSVISNDGGSVITHDGGSLHSQQALAALPGALQAAVITHDGGSLISHDGGSLISHDGGSVITHDGGSIVAKGGYGVLSVNGDFEPPIHGLAFSVARYAAAHGGVGVLHQSLGDASVSAAIAARDADIIANGGDLNTYALLGYAPERGPGETSIPGLIALYQFDDPANLGLDTSGRGGNLAAHGGASFVTGGRFDGALHLDGTGFLSTSNQHVPNGVPLGGQSYTVSAWVNAAASSPPPASPSGNVVFTDNFDEEHGNTGAAMYTAFANWDVTRGSVDLVGPGPGSIDFVPGNGVYVDLAGGEPGTLTSKTTFAPGKYGLQFTIGGTHRSLPDGVHVGFGNYQEDYHLAQGDFRTFYREVTNSSAVPLTFGDTGESGNPAIGTLLFDVNLTYLGPAPAAQTDVVSWGDFGTTGQSNALVINNTRSGVINAWSGNNLAASSNFADGTYHNLTASYDGVVRRIYVDGQLISSDNPGTPDFDLTNFAIGRGNPALGEFFAGDIDNVAIYNRALTGSEIGQIVNGRFVEPANDTSVAAPSQHFVHLQTLASESRLGGRQFETPFGLISGSSIVVATNPDPGIGNLLLQKVTLGGDAIPLGGSASAINPLAFVTSGSAHFFIAGTDAAGRVVYNEFAGDLQALGADRLALNAEHSLPGATAFGDAFFLAGGGLAVTADDSSSGNAPIGPYLERSDVRGHFFDPNGNATTPTDFLVSDGVIARQNLATGIQLADGNVAFVYSDQLPDESSRGGSLSILDPAGNLVQSTTFSLAGFDATSPQQPGITQLAFSGQIAVAYIARDVIIGDDSGVIRVQRFDQDGIRVAPYLQLPGIYDYTFHPIVQATPDGGFIVAAVAAHDIGGGPTNVGITLLQYDASGELLGSDILPSTFGVGVPTIHDLTVAPDGQILINISGTHNDGAFATSEIWSVILARSADNVAYAQAGGQEITIEGQLNPSGEDWIVGSSENDVLTGSDRRSHIFGGNGTNQLRGNGGDDIIYGGNGIDTVVMSGARADFDITRATGPDGVERITITHARFTGTVNDGTDTLIGVERLNFTDVTIDVAQTLTAPVITSNGAGASASVAVRENTIAVTTVTASDSDVGTTLAYAIVGGADAGSFQIDALSGTLSFVAAPDFEAPTDSDHNNTYFVRVRASDGTLIDEQMIAVSVADVSDTPDEPSGPAAPAIPTGTTGRPVDFNGDGIDDLLWRNADGSVSTSTPGGGPVVVGSAPISTLIEGTGDFNGDGRGDILFRSPEGQITAWIMNGQQIATISELGSTSPDWRIEGTGDFNGDRSEDILFRNDSGEVVTWSLQGGQLASIQTAGSADLTWHVAQTGDFNGDGRMDVLWRNDDGRVVDWLMQNGRAAEIIDVGSAPLTAHIVGAGDLNGDRQTDIVFGFDDGHVTEWLMNTGHFSSAADIGSADAAWRVTGTGDVSGDGRDDILWHNDDDGHAVAWLMNGAQLTSVQDLGSTPLTAQPVGAQSDLL